MLRVTKFFISLFLALLCAILPACFEAPPSDDTDSSGTTTATKSATITIAGTELQSFSRESITSTDAGDYLFSNQVIDTTTQVVLTLLNTGDLPADKIKAYSLSSPIAYAGGSYPGTGGTCTTKILGQVSCTIVIAFTPAKIGNNEANLKLGYFNGKTTRTFEKLFKGMGVSSPTVSSLSPSAGGILGGGTLTIVGTQLFIGATVKVGGQTCTVTGQTEPTLILCTLPAHGIGAVDVVITNSDQMAITKASTYTYQLAPTVTSLTTSYGRSSGGTTITVNGTGFLANATVVLGGQACTSVSIVSTSQLTCVTASHAIGSVDIMVMNADGQYGSLLNAYTYYNIPQITTVSPSSGTQDGATSLTITGSEFVTGATVTIGGYNCNSISVVSSTQITCSTPEQSVGSYDVVVTNTNAYSATATNGFAYTPRVESWQAMTTVGAPSGRWFYMAIWTGSKMVVWAGKPAVIGLPGPTDGGQFDPVTNAWSAVSSVGAPVQVMAGSGCIWTGSKMILVGGDGNYNNGGLYDPNQDTWTTLSTTGGPNTRGTNVSAIWTGSKMIVWGGYDPTNSFDVNTGASYNPENNAWTTISSTSAPEGRHLHMAVWSGSKMIIWGGRPNAAGYVNSGGIYDPSANTWSIVATLSAPLPRQNSAALWTGSKMLIWGGLGNFSLNTGGLYDPNTNTWVQTSTINSPSTSTNAYAVWTGSKMIAWPYDYTYFNQGGIYDPVNNNWTAVTTTGMPSNRKYFTPIWTGRQVVVWGGTGDNGATSVNTGAIYTPAGDTASNTWTAMTTVGAADTREDHMSVWTGSKMIVFGGALGGGENNSGGVYDALTNSWTLTSQLNAPSPGWGGTAVWTGSRMLAFGGSLQNYSGSSFDPISNAWTSLPTLNAPSPRFLHSAVWTGSKMVVFDGVDWTAEMNTGASYDPDANTWATMSTLSAPSIRRTYDTAIWTGSKMLVFGGQSGATLYNDGGMYDPNTNIWTSITTTNAPSNRNYNSSSWTGKQLFVFGGCETYNCTSVKNTGGLYDPQSNYWVTVTTTNAPSPRYAHTSTWTGEKAYVWGGFDGGSTVFNTGGAYNPLQNSWVNITTSNAPSARYNHTAVWTGGKILIWGGMSATDYFNTGAAFTP